MAAAAVAVVLAAVFVPMAFVPARRPIAQTVAFEAVADVPVSATATLTSPSAGPRGSSSTAGTATPGPTSEAPAGGWPYALYVVPDRDGNRSEVSSWRASPGKTARLPRPPRPWDLEDIATLEVRSLGSGDVLLLGVSGESPGR